ncbi:hypothetical protein FOA52_014618 [Chlamydomonas sp. UWO 241]|nr:hypothetical protein FOA52_014618 [Chlamydomonas sp. UWO 241]
MLRALRHCSPSLGGMFSPALVGSSAAAFGAAPSVMAQACGRSCACPSCAAAACSSGGVLQHLGMPFGWQAMRGATKKAGGTASQKKPPLPKNRGMKMYGGELIFPGQIIVRQKGTKYHPGAGVGMGRDHTIFATRVGFVSFHDDARLAFNGQPHQRKVISVAPVLGAARAAGAAGEGTGAAEAEAAMIARRAAMRRHLARGRPMEPALYFVPGPTAGQQQAARAAVVARTLEEQGRGGQ